MLSNDNIDSVNSGIKMEKLMTDDNKLCCKFCKLREQYNKAIVTRNNSY